MLAVIATAITLGIVAFLSLSSSKKEAPPAEPVPVVAQSEMLSSTTPEVSAAMPVESKKEILIEKPIAKVPAPVTKETSAVKGYSVQVASMGSQQEAQDKLNELAKVGHLGFIQNAVVNGKSYFRVKIGPVPTKEEAKALKDKLGFPNSIISKD